MQCAARYVPNLTSRVKAHLRVRKNVWYDIASWCIAELENSVDCIDVLAFLRAQKIPSPAVVMASIKHRIASGRASLIEVQRTDVYTVRAKTALNAYDSASLRRAILNADCQGIALRDVMMEYEDACRDLYAMSSTVIEIEGRVYFSEVAHTGPNPEIRALFGLGPAPTL